MNLIDIVNTYVCPMASLPQFDGLVSNTSATARDIKAALRLTGEEIAKRAEWSRMVKNATVSSGESSYDLPMDFHRLINGAAIQLASTPYTVIPLIKSNDIYSMVSALNSTQLYAAIRNGLFIFEPSLPGDATIRYVSKNWLEDEDSTEIDAPTADTNTPQFPDQLLGMGTLWRYKRAKGLAYTDIADEFEALLEREIKADRGIN